MKIGRKTRKIVPKPSKNRLRSEEKSTENRPKTSKNQRKIGCGRLWALQVVPGHSGVARERARDGLRTPSWAVLPAKLAVLAAMLAVLDGKLAAQGEPNGGRSRPQALFERMHELDRRRERSEADF